MARRLSKLLLTERVVGAAVVERALSRKELKGGRLGTNLLEIGAIDANTLGTYLSRVHELPAPHPELMKDVDRSVLRLLNPDDVVQFGAIPIAMVNDRLAVLVKDRLDDDDADELAEQAGCPLEQFLVPEFRFEQALGVLYGVPLSPRAMALARRFPSELSVTGASGAFPRVASSTDDDRGVTDADLDNLGEGWTPERIGGFLARTRSRDRVLAALLGFIGNYASRRFMLAVQHGKLRGLAGRGLDRTKPQIRSVEFDVGQLPTAVPGRHVALQTGTPRDLCVLPFFGALDLELPQECLCFTIFVGNRPALLIVADNWAQPISRAHIPLIEVAVAQTAAALMDLVRQEKLRRSAEHHAIPRGRRKGDAARSDAADSAWTLPQVTEEDTITVERPISESHNDLLLHDEVERLIEEQEGPLAPHDPDAALPAAGADPGAPGDDTLFDALLSDDPEKRVRARAALLLAEDQVVAKVFERFPGPLREDKESAAPIANRGPILAAVIELESRAVPYLVEISRADDRQRRYYACLCFDELRHPDALPALADRLFDDELDIRRLAGRLIWAYVSHPHFLNVLQYLRKALSSRTPSRRVHAAEALGHLEDPDSVLLLVEQLSSGQDDLAAACAESLERLTFQSFGTDARRWRKWLKRHGTESRWQWLMAGVAHRKAHIRALAREAIAKIPDLDLQFDPFGGKREQKRVREALNQHFELAVGVRR